MLSEMQAKDFPVHRFSVPATLPAKRSEKLARVVEEFA
jgi:hypothetical protein